MSLVVLSEIKVSKVGIEALAAIAPMYEQLLAEDMGDSSCVAPLSEQFARRYDFWVAYDGRSAIGFIEGLARLPIYCANGIFIKEDYRRS